MTPFGEPVHDYESELQSDIIKFGEMRGWFIVKITSPSRRGMPDVYAVRRGWHVWIEVKRAGEAARVQQQRVARIMREHGADVRVVDSIEEAREILK